MQNPTDNQKHDKKGAPRLKLPFDKRSGDMGTWSYDHRAGISITVIAYLVFAIIFVSAKIHLGSEKRIDGILIEFPPEERQEQVQQNMEQHYDDFSDVSNRASNENMAELNSSLKDDRGTRASDLYKDADALSDKMRANREAYEAGLRQEQEIINSRAGNEGAAEERQDSKVKGRVTVSFSFDNPVRTSRKLVVPAYMCEGGGEIVVNATLDINGNVIAASIDSARSYGDQCMQDTALRAARSSRFNLDSKAPDKHRGTISYIFIPQ
jgi:hypothetical protein